MPSFGTLAAALMNRLARTRAKPSAGFGAYDAEVDLVARAIRDRELAGMTTTLRQLHEVCDLTQAAALKAVGELEQTGMLEIEYEMHDALDSKVILTDPMCTVMRANEKRAAA